MKTIIGPEILADVRERAGHIIRELGMVIHHCGEAHDEAADGSPNPAQIDEDLASAFDASTALGIHTEALESLLAKLSDSASEHLAREQKKLRPKKGGAS